MDSPRLNTFSSHYRKKFGCSVGKISLDLGIVCPNREKKGGCIFCSPRAFSPLYMTGSGDVQKQLREGKRQMKRNNFEKFFAYFQQETATAAPAETLVPIIREVLAEESCIGIILSTRPDYIENSLLAEIADICCETDRDCVIELGLQSVHQRSLTLLNRNHSMADFTDAVEKIKRYPELEIGVHLIFGIPGENEEDMFTSIREVVRSGVDALKLHHLQILRGTVVEEMYNRGEVTSFSLDGYLDFLLRLLPIIPENIVIHRLWATSHPHLLVAPKWNVLATELSRRLRAEMARKAIRQGQGYVPTGPTV